MLRRGSLAPDPEDDVDAAYLFSELLAQNPQDRAALLAALIDPAPLARRLANMNTLTPGDFANVVRQRTLLGEAPSTGEFLRRLIVECRHKAGKEVAA